MASFDWHKWLDYGKGKARSLPIWAWVAAASVVLAALLLVVFISGAPAYTPLYEGLSSKQGGEVIEKLQKMGVPYRLNSSGSVISVPDAQLAEARLQLGKLDVPHSEGSEAWNQLTNGSMTTSQTAQDALSRRSLEHTLETTITGMHGVVEARVTLAVPESTPFLKDQPEPKASVWLKVVPR